MLGAIAAALAASGPFIFVANGGQRPSIAVYGSASPSPLYRIVRGVTQPTAIAVDRFGTLYVANRGSTAGAGGYVSEYVFGSAVPSLTVTSGVGNVTAMTVDGSGTLFVANGAGPQPANDVAVYARGRRALAYAIANTIAPYDVTTDSYGRLYAATANGIFAYARGSTVPFLSIPSCAGGSFTAMTAGGNGAIFAGTNTTLCEYAPGSSTPRTQFAVTAASSLVLRPGQNLVQAGSSNGNFVTEYRRFGPAVLRSMSENAPVAGIAVDRLGRLYAAVDVTNPSGVPGEVLVYPPNGSLQPIRVLTAGIAFPFALAVFER